MGGAFWEKGGVSARRMGCLKFETREEGKWAFLFLILILPLI